MEGERRELEQEATELMNIFGSILRKSECRFEHSIFEFVSPASRTGRGFDIRISYFPRVLRRIERGDKSPRYWCQAQ